MADLASRFASMKHGDEVEVSHGDPSLVADPVSARVKYVSEQALGDNNQPAKGYTVGHFHVNGPGEEHASFRHTPHGPTLTGAKPYAAQQAADHVSKRIQATFNNRTKEQRRGAGNGTEGQPGLTSL